jgi:hypothetical protein
LIDWARTIGQLTPDLEYKSLRRSSDISITFGGQYVPFSHEWTPDINWQGIEGSHDFEGMTPRLRTMFTDQIDFHSMHFGSLDSVLQSINVLLEKCSTKDLLIDLYGLYFSTTIQEGQKDLPRVLKPPPPPPRPPPGQPPPPPRRPQPPPRL